MSDDVVPIHWREGRPWARSGYPRLRLWDETAQGLYGHPAALPRLTPNWPKRYLDLQTDRREFSASEQPIGAIFVLQERAAGSPSVERLNGHGAAMQLVANTSMGLHLDAESRVRELEGVVRLTSHVPVFRAHASDDLGRIDEFCDLIVATAAL